MQMRQFGVTAEEKFSRQLANRTRTGFGSLIAATGLDDAGVAHTVRQVIDLARSHVIDHEQDVKTFLDRVMTLQSGLDDDPRYPRATDILARRELARRGPTPTLRCTT